MNNSDRNLLDEFTTILEQYKVSPFGFRLRRTGRTLKFIEYNGLFYLDTQNLLNIVDELLGPNIPEEIVVYLEKIVFAEEITVESRSCCETKQVTCTQFIDDRFFDKCIGWLKQRPASQPVDDRLHFTGAICDDLNPITEFRTRNPGERPLFLDDMFPFRDIFRTESYAGAKKPVYNSIYTGTHSIVQGYTSKPRGKQMNEVPENTADRPFACDIPFCNRAFKRYEHLKRHMKMHSGERPFKCMHPGCSKSFSRSDNLNQHYKTHNVGAMRPEMYFDIDGKSFREY